MEGSDSLEKDLGKDTQREYALRFEADPLITTLGDRIATTPVDWERTVSRLEPNLLRSKHYQEGHLASLLFETHVEAVVQSFAQTESGITYPFITTPVETPRYVIRKGGSAQNNIVVNEKDRQGKILPQHYTEYDVVLSVYNTPVIVEVKKTTRPGLGNAEERGLGNALRADSVNRKVTPFVDAFSPHLGYVVITMPEALQDTQLEREFVSNGGILRAIPETYEEFHFRATQATYNRLL